jgi:hypothetical protein
MHIFIHLIILFIYVFVLLTLNIPQIAHDDYIKMKLYIFVGIFIFEFIVTIILTLLKRCLINVGKIARNSLQSALIAVVAYSIYNDLVWSKNSLVTGQENSKRENFTITVMITTFIALGYFLEIILTDHIPGINDCLNTIYPSKKN